MLCICFYHLLFKHVILFIQILRAIGFVFYLYVITTDWFQIGKGVRQGCILSPCVFSLYAEYIMRNAGLEEAQAGIKIAGRNINNLKYADDTTFLAESEEELKSLLMKVKEESENLASSLIFRKLRSWHPVPLLHGK